MAEHTEEHETTQPKISAELSTTLAMIAGGGIIAIMIVLGYGVIAPNANNNLIGLIVMAGFAALILGVGGWIIAVQPHKHFDDINQPHYHGHNHDDDGAHAEDDVHNAAH